MTIMGPWRTWFAWYPIVIDGKSEWLRLVQRRRVEVPIGILFGSPVSSVFTQYRRKP